jgi:3-oxoacyl-[acyl-carrier-protein] synthase-3
LGCSGYVYGISIIASMMRAMGLKRGVLLAGDTISKIISNSDKSTLPLFGDAGSATAFEIDPSANDLLFDLGSDGSGKDAIILKDGGARNKITPASLKYHEIDLGIKRNTCQLVLEGMDVFSFGINQVPKTVEKLIQKFELDKEAVDYFVFHQANLMMNKMIAKKLKLPIDKIPFSLKFFGNTSSASIPLTIVTELKSQIEGKQSDLIMCGFGVGLSWGTIFAKKCQIECLNLIQI